MKKIPPIFSLPRNQFCFAKESPPPPELVWQGWYPSFEYSKNRRPLRPSENHPEYRSFARTIFLCPKKVFHGSRLGPFFMPVVCELTGIFFLVWTFPALFWCFCVSFVNVLDTSTHFVEAVGLPLWWLIVFKPSRFSHAEFPIQSSSVTHSLPSPHPRKICCCPPWSSFPLHASFGYQCLFHESSLGFPAGLFSPNRLFTSIPRYPAYLIKPSFLGIREVLAFLGGR